MNKQIEEMARAIYNLDHCEGYKDDRGCMYAPSCSVCKYGRENKAKQISQLLAKQGYRKASEVVEDVMKYLDDMGYLNIEPHAVNAVEAELRKKYESEGTEDE